MEKNDEIEAEAGPFPGAIKVFDDRESGCPNNLDTIATQDFAYGCPPASRVKSVQDWEGPDDPGNPHNWSSWKKAYHFWPTAFMALSVTAGASLISPANEDLQDSFNVSRTAAIVPITVFVIGLGLGPLIAAPLSEQYGRSIIYQLTAPLYILFLIGTGCSNTFAGVLICRFLAGLAGAPVLAVGAGTNADLFEMKNRAVASAAFISAPFLGPALGPIIGGFAAQFRGWQWTVWCNIIIAGAGFLSVLPMRETYKKVILQRRAKKNNLPPPPGAQTGSLADWKALFTTTLTRPFYMLVLEPIVLLLAIYNATSFCIMFGFFPAFPYTFGKVYNFNTWQSGLAFTGIGTGVLLGYATNIFIDKFVYQRKHREALSQSKTAISPEHRLYAGMLGAIGLPAGLFWFAWTARPDVHWISPILAGIPFGWGNLCLFLSATLYQVDVYGPRAGASAMAANGLLRYTACGCFPLFTIQMYEALGVAWATSLLGFVCVLLLPIPFVFFKFGPAIRAKSRFDTPKN